MGLDMYLSAKLYVSGYDHSKGEEKARFAAAQKALRELPGVTRPYCTDGDDNSIEIKVPVMYWRKANAIHSWFVREVQDGEDNCAYYYVAIEKLIELRDKCATVMLARCEKVSLEELAPMGGFFFGSTDVDEWFYEGVQRTLLGLNKLIEQHERGELAGWDFEYHSSW